MIFWSERKRASMNESGASTFAFFCIKTDRLKAEHSTKKHDFFNFCRTIVGSSPSCAEITFIIKAKQKYSRGRTRTSDLRVMSPTSCQLLYPAAQEKSTANRRICQGIEIFSIGLEEMLSNYLCTKMSCTKIFSDTIPGFNNQDKKIGV